eukprot:ANDGO_05170.mRNA.1 hypothetical protein
MFAKLSTCSWHRTVFVLFWMMLMARCCKGKEIDSVLTFNRSLNGVYYRVGGTAACSWSESENQVLSWSSASEVQGTLTKLRWYGPGPSPRISRIACYQRFMVAVSQPQLLMTWSNIASRVGVPVSEASFYLPPNLLFTGQNLELFEAANSSVVAAQCLDTLSGNTVVAVLAFQNSDNKWKVAAVLTSCSGVDSPRFGSSVLIMSLTSLAVDDPAVGEFCDIDIYSGTVLSLHRRLNGLGQPATLVGDSRVLVAFAGDRMDVYCRECLNNPAAPVASGVLRFQNSETIVRNLGRVEALAMLTSTGYQVKTKLRRGDVTYVTTFAAVFGTKLDFIRCQWNTLKDPPTVDVAFECFSEDSIALPSVQPTFSSTVFLTPWNLLLFRNSSARQLFVQAGRAIVPQSSSRTSLS